MKWEINLGTWISCVIQHLHLESMYCVKSNMYYLLNLFIY